MSEEQITSEDIRLIQNIRWLSVDRDNMEFTALASCYQVDAIKKLLRLAALQVSEPLPTPNSIDPHKVNL